MLIEFSVENWMSFRDKTTLSMIATQEKQHKDTLAYIDEYDFHVLPVTAIYGGNASGKSNLIKAMKFAQDFITSQRKINQRINPAPFKLEKENLSKPTVFEFMILIEKQIYRYSFSVNSEKVLYETLVRMGKSSDKTLFERTETEFVIQDKKLKNATVPGEVIKNATRPNELFLAKIMELNVDLYSSVYDWFEETLKIIDTAVMFSRSLTDVTLINLCEPSNPDHELLNSMISTLDTGIQRMGLRKKNSLESLNLPVDMRNDILENLGTENVGAFIGSFSGERYLLRLVNNEVEVREPISFHTDRCGEDVEFSLEEESDGTRRVLDLFPLFNGLVQEGLDDKNRSKVLIIDELDRSLHSILTRELIAGYLQECDSSKRSQLIFTTHDLFLMDQKLLRRDEMAVTERGFAGATSLTPLSDYKGVRNDKDIRKLYLSGVLGGIPKILLHSLEGPDIPGDKEDE